MALNLKTPTLLNGRRRRLNLAAAGIFPLHRWKTREPIRQQVDGSSLPLSLLLNPTTNHSLDRTRRKIAFVLPHPSPLLAQQEMLVNSNPRHPMLANLRDKRFVTIANSCVDGVNACSDCDVRGRRVFSQSELLIVNLSHFSSFPSCWGSYGTSNDSNRRPPNYSTVRQDLGSSGDEQGSKLLLRAAFRNVLSSSARIQSGRFIVNPGTFSTMPRFRGFCSASSDSEIDDVETGEESNGNDVNGEDCAGGNLKADLKEVERVCKVIEELFALDRNMEAVLDECGIWLTHDLVVDVLERFKHARRPAFRFFCWAGQRPGFSHDSRTYNVMMTILGKTRQFETMVSLLEEIGEKGFLTLETFQISIKAFAAAKERKKALWVFDLMKKYKFKVEVDSINCLLDNLCRAKLGKEAQALFWKLESKFIPTLQTYTVLLNGWCKVKNLMEAGKIWNEMVDKGLKPDIIAHNTMLDGLLKCHKTSDAIKLIELMKAKGPAPNVRSYTILIRYLCKHNKMNEAAEQFEEMLKFDCEADAAIYTCLITGYGNQRKMDKIRDLLKEMKKKGCPPDGRLYNALIKLMTTRRMPEDAVRIYKKMTQDGIEPTIHTFNMMMKSFFMCNNYDMGCAVWEEMKHKGICPDNNSYNLLVGGLIKQGKSDEAFKYLEEMIDKGMKADLLDYNKFFAHFARFGRLDLLKEFAERMKFEGKFELSNIFERWAEMTRKRSHFTVGRKFA